MSETTVRLMAHLVAGYPDPAGAAAIAQALVEGGATYLEVQIPFSDPSADGPAIRDACSVSLDGGCSVESSLAFIADLRRKYPSVPVFVMAYASLVVTPGVGAFVDAVKRAGAAGLIVPDLPFDADEGLAEACRAVGLDSVPVAAPSMRPERLASMAALGRPYLYAALRAGITGSATEIGEDTRRFLEAAGSGGSKVLGGFGIRTGAQARSVAPAVHAVVAGSVFVEAAGAALAAWRTGRRGSAPEKSPVRDEALRRAVREAASGIVRG